MVLEEYESHSGSAAESSGSLRVQAVSDLRTDLDPGAIGKGDVEVDNSAGGEDPLGPDEGSTAAQIFGLGLRPLAAVLEDNRATHRDSPLSNNSHHYKRACSDQGGLTEPRVGFDHRV
jgi:hypothetical protein